MVQIVGWFQETGAQQEGRALTARMLDAALPSGAVAPGDHLIETASWFSVGTSPGGMMHSEDDCLVAWTGAPYWHDPGDPMTPLDGAIGPSLVQAWRNEGASSFSGLCGPFSLIFVDKTDRRVFLSIDRLGLERLAFASVRNGYLFGSNLDAFCEHPDFQADVDAQALYNYLYFHVIPSPGAVYRDTKKLRPGDLVEVSASGASVRLSGAVSRRSGGVWDESQALDVLPALLMEAVKRDARGSDVAAFLSGGLDSSTVVGMASHDSDSEVVSYCAGFDAEGYDETGFARLSARHYSAPLVELKITPADVEAGVDIVARAYDEPFGNASAVPAYFCALAATKDGFSRILAGDGGDELFAGNERYSRQLLFDMYYRVPERLRGLVVEPAIRMIGDRAPSLLKKVRSYVAQARIPLPERLETYNLIGQFQIRDVLEPDLLTQIDLQQPMAMLRESYFAPEGLDALKRMLHLDMKFTLADNDIRKVSRMCEWAGIEVAYPMLDERVVRFADEIPSRSLLRRGELRTFYKGAMRSHLPPHTLSKTKHGFGLPFGVWMKSDRELRDFTHQNVRSLASRGIVRSEFVDMVLRKHEHEHAGYYGVLVWLLLVLERWCRLRGIVL